MKEFPRSGRFSRSAGLARVAERPDLGDSRALVSSALSRLDLFFARRGWRPFAFQQKTWRAYLGGKSGLLHAPTGQGKTLAVFLGPLAESLERPDEPGACRVLWITPLRALAADTLRALREPLTELSPQWQAEARTGDSSSAVRARLRQRLPHTLVTTPESLSLMLSHGDFRERVAGLRCVIVDEWHELLGTKRGVQTELCLARLRQWLPSLRIWGLSATLGNLPEARQTLLGSAASDSVEIAASSRKPVVIDTVIPAEIDRFPWAGHLGLRLAPQVAREIEKADTTLLFTNTRSQTEIWFQELLEQRPQWRDHIAMHHGSLDPSERRRAEDGLRDGSLKCVVATSSLDLGVDFSPVEQVIQVGSPKGIARLLQRAGRAGHQPGRPSRVLCVPTHAVELIEFAAARDAAAARRIESRMPLARPLDLLVQHLVTCAIGEPFEPVGMLREIRSTHAYRDLSEAEWRWALDFICHGGSALAAYPRYRKVRVDEDGRYRVDDKRLIQQHRFSIGTITSDPAVAIRFANGQTLGTVEESFIARLKPGSVLVFGGRHLVLVRFHQRVATVKAAPRNVRGHVAIWGGSKMPLSSELAHAVSRRLRGEGPPCPEMTAVAPILDLQRRWSRIPDDASLLVEHTRSREGEHLFVYPLAGRLVHDGLAALMAFRLSRQSGESIHTTHNDYGFSLTARRLSPSEADIREALDENGLLDDLLACMNTAELARRQFREIARVSGLILQPPPGRPVRSQRELQSSASLLFEVLERYDPQNLLLHQSRREILERQLEITRLAGTLRSLRDRPLHRVETERLSPMAFPLWADRLTALLPAGDAASRLEAMLEQLNQAAR